jgi:outer membrane protein OmpA-like peptidoglycan-associated protein
MKKILLTTLCLLSVSLFAQNVEFKAANFKNDKEGLKKAQDAIKTGDDFWEAGNEKVFATENPGDNYKKALQSYLIAQEFNPNNAELNFKVGSSYFYTNQKYKAPGHIQKAVELGGCDDPFMDYYIGFAHQLNNEFDKAIKSYGTFQASYRKADKFSKFVDKRKKECKMAKEKMANPERVWVDNVKELNTAQDEFSPTVTTDGSTMIFTSNRKNGRSSNALGEFDHDIYSSEYVDGKWQKAKPLGGQINTAEDDFGSNLSYDGNKMLMFRKDGEDYDIYESFLNGLDWSEPVGMSNNINKAYNETYASYNFDDVKIFYLSDYQVGMPAGMNIYFSGVMNRKNRTYGSAVTAGSEINSKFDEGSIYLHPDGKTMYFSSAGHDGLGGLDIYMSIKRQGKWSEPINLGYPINTPYDDVFFAGTAGNKYAYIASNRPGGSGGMDIYKVTYWGPDKPMNTDVEDYLLASALSPIKDNEIKAAVEVNRQSLTVFKGRTIDALTKKPVEANIDIIDNANGKVIKTITTNSATGKFLISLNSGKNYGIAVKADGYLFHSENFDIPQESAYQLINKEIELKNIKIGSKIALRNIFFETAKSTLKSESDAELARLVKLMKDVPGLKVEISGHTDNTGSAKLNDQLSKDRAQAVVTYLIGKGIDKSRLTAAGYGSSDPIASNNSAEGRQQNRRVEFKITGN